MCGIAGIIAPQIASPELRVLLDRMLAAIRHRGPDDSGTYFRDRLALGMRRLSVIDLEGGHQPMVSDDGKTVLVFNGEIYNFRELQAELSGKGHVFHTRCDTEAVLHGYRQWREEVLEHLSGMFAFAVYDRRDEELLLARDHFGIKPLYYFAGRDLFAFCSEPSALLEMPGVSRCLDLDSLRCFLSYKYVPAPSSFVRGIKKLEPGTYMRVDRRGQVVCRRTYWRLCAGAVESDGVAAPRAHLKTSVARASRRVPLAACLPVSRDSRPLARRSTGGQAAGDTQTGLLVRTLREHLVAAVERQLMSDVPLGVFLSGGIDSGLLLWAARQARPESPPRAYTVGFGGTSFDESLLASKTAARLDVEHHIERELRPSPDDLDGMVMAFGEPFANVSIPANFVISRVAARHVKVALNGSGADELFGGYDRYYAVRPPWPLAAARGLSPLLLPLARALGVGDEKRSLVTRGRRFLEATGAPPAEAHAGAIRLFTASELLELAPDLGDGDDPILRRFADAPACGDLERAIWVDITTMLADDYLTLVDRTSMAASLEVRVPFLDLDLARYAFSLPSSYKINGWEKKRILRRLAMECLPHAVARGPKEGFESPVGTWFRGPLGERLIEILRDSPLNRVLETRCVERLVREHRSRRRDAAKQLLGIYTLCEWAASQSISA